MSDQTLRKVGVQLVAEGESTFTKSMANANASVSNFGKQTQMSASNIGSSLLGVVTKGNLMAQGIIMVGQQVVGAAQRMAKSFKDMVGETARFDQMVMVSQMLGEKVGVTNKQIDGQIEGIRKMGIEAEAAADTVAQFTRYQLDMTKATELARVAQDAAVLSNSNSTETLQRLIWGIQTQNSETLRTAGIQMSTGQAMDEYAKTIGKGADQLNSAERSQAMLNAILKEGEKIAGAYEISMTNAWKKLGSLERVINDLQVSMGKPFQEAFSTGVDLITNFVKTLNKYTDNPDSGISKLFKVLADSMNVALDSANNAVPAIIQWIDNLAGTLADNIQDLGDNMFEWGWNTIVTWVEGMAQGFAYAIVPVINSISNFITYAFETKSPPRILPDIHKWGVGTIQEWLNGFTEGDYSVLTSVQQSISSALRLISDDTQWIGEQQLSFSKAIIQVIESGEGELELLNNITNSLAPFGDAIAKLTKLNFDYVRSQKAVESANQKVQESYEKEQALTQRLSIALDAYNKLKRAGASTNALQAQLGEINSIRSERASQSSATTSAIMEANAASNAVTEIANQMNLQEKLFSQLVTMGESQVSVTNEIARKIDLWIAEQERIARENAKSLQGLGDGIFSAFTSTFDALSEEFKDAIAKGAGVAPLYGTPSQPVENPITKALDGLKDKVNTALDPLKVALESLNSKIVTSGLIDDMSNSLKTIIDILPKRETVQGMKLAGQFIGSGGNLKTFASMLVDENMIGGGEGGPSEKAIKDARNRIVNMLIYSSMSLVTKMIAGKDLAEARDETVSMVTTLISAGKGNIISGIFKTVFEDIEKNISDIFSKKTTQPVSANTSGAKGKGIDSQVSDLKSNIFTMLLGSILEDITGVSTKGGKLAVSGSNIITNFAGTIETITKKVSGFREQLRKMLRVDGFDSINTFMKSGGTFDITYKFFNKSILEPLQTAWQWVTDKVNLAKEAVKKFADMLDSIKIPPGLVPRSPPPLAKGFIYVNEALAKTNKGMKELGRTFDNMELPSFLVMHSPSPLEQALSRSARAASRLNTIVNQSPILKGRGGGSTTNVPLPSNYTSGSSNNSYSDMVAPPTVYNAGAIQNSNTTNYNVNVNASYANSQSQARIGDDIFMALRLARSA